MPHIDLSYWAFEKVVLVLCLCICFNAAHAVKVDMRTTLLYCHYSLESAVPLMLFSARLLFYFLLLLNAFRWMRSYFPCVQLAHPLYGNMPIEFRPVDCYTSKPLNPTPPYVSRSIYGENGIEPGWGWNPYGVHRSRLHVAGEGLQICTFLRYNICGAGSILQFGAEEYVHAINC